MPQDTRKSGKTRSELFATLSVVLGMSPLEARHAPVAGLLRSAFRPLHPTAEMSRSDPVPSRLLRAAREGRASGAKVAAHVRVSVSIPPLCVPPRTVARPQAGAQARGLEQKSFLENRAKMNARCSCCWEMGPPCTAGPLGTARRDECGSGSPEPPRRQELGILGVPEIPRDPPGKRSSCSLRLVLPPLRWGCRATSLASTQPSGLQSARHTSTR